MVWLEAGQKTSLERDYFNLYQTLFGLQSAAGQEVLGIENTVVGVKSWFSGRQGPWLMVFDGGDTIENEQTSDLHRHQALQFQMWHRCM
jgi:hypothetical protein